MCALIQVLCKETPPAEDPNTAVYGHGYSYIYRRFALRFAAIAAILALYLGLLLGKFISLWPSQGDSFALAVKALTFQAAAEATSRQSVTLP